jgi:hypothetical protein
VEAALSGGEGKRWKVQRGCCIYCICGNDCCDNVVDLLSAWRVRSMMGGEGQLKKVGWCRAPGNGRDSARRIQRQES